MARTPGSGRPSKLTPEVHDRIIQTVGAGVPRHVAAQSAGVSYSVIKKWVSRGRAQTAGAYRDFVTALEKAQSDAVVRNVAIIQKAAMDTWQAAAWWLERRHYKDFGRKDRKEITGAKGGPLKVEAVRGMIEDPDIIALMRARREWKPEAAPTEPPTDGYPGQG